MRDGVDNPFRLIRVPCAIRYPVDGDSRNIPAEQHRGQIMQFTDAVAVRRIEQLVKCSPRQNIAQHFPHLRSHMRIGKADIHV